jgi:putative transposase
MKQKEWNTTGNCVYVTWYHLVWSTKYRYPVLVGSVAERVKQILTEVCETRGYELKAQEVMPDHIHLLISIPPAEAVSDAVKVLKGTSARLVFLSHPHLKKRLWGEHLWNPAYYVGTAGEVSQKTIERYIASQKQHAAPDA